MGGYPAFLGKIVLNPNGIFWKWKRVHIYLFLNIFSKAISSIMCHALARVFALGQIYFLPYLIVTVCFCRREREVEKRDVDPLAGVDADDPGARLGAEPALRRDEGAQIPARPRHVHLLTRVTQAPYSSLNYNTNQTRQIH